MYGCLAPYSEYSACATGVAAAGVAGLAAAVAVER